jgi:molybdopterin molybdotransferase
VGEEDHIKPAVQQLGSLDLWQIAMKPGKPFAYGTVMRHGCEQVPHTAHFIGLPGNPVSSFMTFVLLVRPFLLRLQGVAHVRALCKPCPRTSACPGPTSGASFCACGAIHKAGLSCLQTKAQGC